MPDNKDHKFKTPAAYIRGIMYSGKDIRFRIMNIIAIAAATANTIGFLANLIMYGMNAPTAFCALCDVLAILYLIFGLRRKSYVVTGWILIIILLFLEFPMLTFAYGPVMYPYMVMGLVALVMLIGDRARIPVMAGAIAYYVAIIIWSTFDPYIFGTQEATGLVGSAVVTFVVSAVTNSLFIVSIQSVNVNAAVELDPISATLSQVGFLNSVERYLATRPRQELAILSFDIKGFKSVNAVYGVDGGNELLRQVSERINNSGLKPRFIGRTNGDNFLCLVDRSNIDTEEINRLCKYRFAERGKYFAVVLNCGIYPITDRGVTVQSMCDRAHLVLRFIKDGYLYGTYNPEIEISFKKEAEVLSDVEEAIHKEEFEPFYQPIVDSKTGKIVSAEALSRWVHPEKGLIPPGVFVPVMEQRDLITDLDTIIANKVNSFMERREAEGKVVVPISVNLSRVDLFNGELIHKLHVMVKESNVKGHVHRFEITESAYEALPDNIVDTLAELRELGAKILVDDFGSGYSSLGMITDYEFDIIKLDMKFANRIETSERTRGIIKSLIDLSHSLYAKVVAEGVETRAQYEFMREAGCDYIQGYYFYKPMREAEFAKLLDEKLGR